MGTLFAVVDSKDVVLYITSILAAIGAVSFGVRFKNWKESRRRKFNKLAEELSKRGLKDIPAIFSELGVGNKTGAVKKGLELAEILEDPDSRERYFKETMIRVAKAALADKDQKAALLELIAEHNAGLKK